MCVLSIIILIGLILTLSIAPMKMEGNRRLFFEHFAKVNNFDYLIPKNWYLQSREKIMATKVIDLLKSFVN